MDRLMIRDDNALPWYALQVRSCYEKTVASNLFAKEYECFLPIYHRKRQWSDRIMESEQPLFPGYLFSKFDVNKRLPILTTPHVMRIVGCGNTIQPVDSKEILAIMAVVASGFRAWPMPYHQIGQRVRIEYGALAGVEGIIIDSKAPTRLVVSVSLLQRSVALEIDEADVIPI
jgi:transcription antitermination factor NusG